jgi:KH domain-containing RNA-binding signal transduction-associated protein 3
LQEEELRASGDPKYAHFNDDLHVEITAFAPPAEAHARIAYALAEVRKFLVPVRDRHNVCCPILA